MTRESEAGANDTFQNVIKVLSVRKMFLGTRSARLFNFQSPIGQWMMDSFVDKEEPRSERDVVLEKHIFRI